MRKTFLSAALIAALAVPVLALATMTSNTVKPRAKLAGEGAAAKVKVLLACDTDQSAKLKVTLTQGSDHGLERAFGRGAKEVECGMADEVYRVRTEAKKETVFAKGKATACVLALTDDDARQWCVEVKLVEK